MKLVLIRVVGALATLALTIAQVTVARADCSVEVEPSMTVDGRGINLRIDGVSADVSARNLTLTVGTESCTLELADGEMGLAGNASCTWLRAAAIADPRSTREAQLAASGTTPEDGLNACNGALTVKTTNYSSVDGTFDVSGESLEFELSAPVVEEMVLEVDGAYRRRDVADKEVRIDNLTQSERDYLANESNTQIRAFVRSGDNWRLATLARDPGDTSPSCTLAPVSDSWCPESTDKNVHICISATENEVWSERALPSRVRPDATLVLHMQHCQGVRLDVEVRGERGNGRSVVLDTRTPAGDDSGTPEEALRQTPTQPRTRERNLGMYQPGHVTVRVRHAGTDRWQSEDSTTVVPTYWGALRIGLGVVFGKLAVPDHHTVGLAPGSMQREIMVRNTRHVAVEVVIGATAYLPLDRAHLLRRRYDFLGIFVGFGVISAQAQSGLTGLTSVYLGLEFEIVPEVALVTAAVLRRGQHLSDGYAVGSPFDSDSAPTGERWGPGFGLLLNISTEVFRLTKDN